MASHSICVVVKKVDKIIISCMFLFAHFFVFSFCKTIHTFIYGTICNRHAISQTYDSKLILKENKNKRMLVTKQKSGDCNSVTG